MNVQIEMNEGEREGEKGRKEGERKKEREGFEGKNIKSLALKR